MQKIIKFVLCGILMLSLTSCGSNYTGLKTPLAGAQPEEITVSDSGIAARQGEWIYYINGDNFTREENGRFHIYAGALCRMKEDGSEKQVVVDRDVSVFNIRGEEIYLCVYDDGSYIAKVRIDGSNYKVLKKIDDIYYGGCYAFSESGIYYTKDFRLYRMDFDGKQNKKLTDFKIYNLRVDGDKVLFTREENESIGSIFYLENDESVKLTKESAYVLNISGNETFYYLLSNGTVYKYSFDENEHKAVIYGGYTEYAFDTESGIYVFSATENSEGDPAGIYVIPCDGGEKTQVSENSGRCMTVYDGYIYYINTSKLNYLYRCSLDGSVDECLSEEFVFDYDTLDRVDGYIYFFSDSDYDRVYRVNTQTKKVECVEYEEFSTVG